MSVQTSLREEIRSLAKMGMNRADIMRLLNEHNPDLHLTYDTVYRQTRDIVTVLRDVTQTRVFIGDRPRRDVVMEMYEGGMTRRQIATQLHLKYRQVMSDMIYVERLRRREREQEDALKNPEPNIDRFAVQSKMW